MGTPPAHSLLAAHLLVAHDDDPPAPARASLPASLPEGAGVSSVVSWLEAQPAPELKHRSPLAKANATKLRKVGNLMSWKLRHFAFPSDSLDGTGATR
jgi:hypothetical protein